MSFSDYLLNTLKIGGSLLFPGSAFSSQYGIPSMIRDSFKPTSISGHAQPVAGYTPPTSSWNPGNSVMGDSSPAQDNSTEQIMQQLQALQDPGRYMMDQGGLQSQARSQAAAQYEPVINALMSQKNSANQRGQNNKAALGSMFNQLSSSISGDLPAINQNYDKTMQNSAQQSNDLQASITGQYQKSQQEQEAMYKRLNIQAAAPDALPQQQTNRDFALTQAKTNGQTQQDALTQERQGAVNYTNSGAQGARAEGTQRQADLMAQLSDLMSQYDSQIGANQAAESQSYNSILGQLTSQNQSNALSRAQSDFQNYLSAVNLGRGLDSDKLDQLVKMQGLNKSTPVKSLSDVGNAALGLGLPTQSAMNIQNVFSQSVLSNPLITAGMDPNTGAQLTPEAKAAQMVEAGRQKGLSQAELNALQNMALQYFGRS